MKNLNKSVNARQNVNLALLDCPDLIYVSSNIYDSINGSRYPILSTIEIKTTFNKTKNVCFLNVFLNSIRHANTVNNPNISVLKTCDSITPKYPITGIIHSLL